MGRTKKNGTNKDFRKRKREAKAYAGVAIIPISSPRNGPRKRPASSPSSNNDHKNEQPWQRRRKTKKKKKKKQEEIIEWKTISKEEIQQFPLLAWTGETKVLTTIKDMEVAVAEIMEHIRSTAISGDDAEYRNIIGFDTETKPNYVKGGWNPTALVQLAPSNATVYVFRISFIDQIKPLLPILNSSKLLKVGVGIQNDVKELRKSYGKGFHPQGFVDITTTTKNILRYQNTGLGALTAIFLKGKLSKKCQMSNWEGPLNEERIQYAATDAYVGREIYMAAERERIAKEEEEAESEK